MVAAREEYNQTIKNDSATLGTTIEEAPQQILDRGSWRKTIAGAVNACLEIAQVLS